MAYYTGMELQARNPSLSPEQATRMAKEMVAKGQWSHI